MFLLLIFLIPRVKAQNNYYNNYQEWQNLIKDGEAALDSSNFDHAVSIFQKMIQMRSYSYEGYFYMGLASQFTGKRGDAFSYYEQALRQAPKEPRIYATRAMFVLDSVGDADRALADISKAFKYSSKAGANLYYDRARIYLAKNDKDHAKEDIDWLIKYFPYVADAYNLRGGIALDDGNQDAAAQDFNHALNLNPQNPGANYGLGMIASKKKEYYNAISYFTKAINLAGIKLPEAIQERSDAYSMIFDVPHAMNDSKWLATALPDYPGGWYGLGWCYEVSGEYQASIDAYQKVINLSPSDGDVYTQIIISFARLHRFDEAAVNYHIYKDKGLTTDFSDKHWTFYDFYARAVCVDIPAMNISAALDDINQSLAAYDSEVKEKEEYLFSEGYDLKGYILERLGRPAEALQAYKAALRLTKETQPLVNAAIDRIQGGTTLAPSFNLPNSGTIVAATENPPRYYALLFAEQNYSDRTLNSLNHPIAELTAFRLELINHYGFLPEDVKLYQNSDRNTILNAIEQTCNTMTRDDNLLIYYAGHGFAKDYNADDSETFWVPAQARNRDMSSYVSYDEVVHRLNFGSARHILLISDACFGPKSMSLGRGASRGLEQIYRKGSRTLMTSGSSEVPDNSLLAKYLISGLANNHESFIDARRLFEGFRVRLMDDIHFPTDPEYKNIFHSSEEQGDFVFCRQSQ